MLVQVLVPVRVLVQVPGLELAPVPVLGRVRELVPVLVPARVLVLVPVRALVPGLEGAGAGPSWTDQS